MILSVHLILALSTCVFAIDAPPPTTCLDCHNRDRRAKGQLSIAEKLTQSPHAKLDCTDCHASLSMDDVKVDSSKPHGDAVAPASCADCHEEESELYVRHGRLKVGSNPDVPTCGSCHGSHDILPSADLNSRVHPRNLAKTCQSCHANVDILRQHDILRDEPIKLYQGSVHGRATKTGLFMAATCGDCHSSAGPDGGRTAHRILSPSDPESTTSHFKIPETCGKCHEGTLKDYWDGIHGQLAKKGVLEAPVCTACHGEHGILAVSDMRSPVSPARLAEATCARCHESELLNERFGIAGGRLTTYVDSYHGLKRKAGSVRVANCSSCHGNHAILSHTDPRSSIHPDNLPNTCGNCHPGISTELALSPIHETATGMKAGWPRFFTVFYKWLIGFTIGLMLLHNVGHWWRSVRMMTKKPSVTRMTGNETAQHWVLMISFIALVISGFSLRYSEAWWVHLLFGWGGGEGFVFRGLIHRIAAVVFMIWTVWHLFYLLTPRGRRWFMDMLARWNDLTHIRENALFFLGKRGGGARFARFSYMEKCEYWALMWGTVIMIVTGVLLWFDNFLVEKLSLPKGLLDVALVIHYYEAWLATLAIFVWHIYGVIFSPGVYPMNPAWLSGRMPEEMYRHEHPAVPAIPAVSVAPVVPVVPPTPPVPVVSAASPVPASNSTREPVVGVESQSSA